MLALAIARKNLACLVSNPNLYICKPHVSFFLSIHNFTTSRERQTVTKTAVYDVLLHNHHFSPELASRAASDSTKHCSPERADSILSLLKENGVSITQLEKIVKYKPRILGVSVEDIKFKFKIFQDLGFSTQEAANLFSKNPVILHLSARGKIIPSLSVLKGLLGSNGEVGRVLRKSAWFVLVDLEKTLVPNVEMLKCCGIAMEHIPYFLCKFPRSVLMKPDSLRRLVDKAKEMGVTQSSKMFILAVGVIASTSEGTWVLKFRALHDLGFSDSDIVEMFKKAPPAFCVSTVKIKKVTELLLAAGKFDMSSIVTYPSSFGRSIEKRYKPRLQILEILESRNLIAKWPSLSTIAVLPDDRFFDTFVKPYSNQLDKNVSLGVVSNTKDR